MSTGEGYSLRYGSRSAATLLYKGASYRYNLLPPATSLARKIKSKLYQQFSVAGPPLGPSSQTRKFSPDNSQVPLPQSFLPPFLKQAGIGSGSGSPLWRIPPSTLSVNRTTVEPTPFPQCRLCSALSIVWSRILPLASNWKAKSPMNSLGLFSPLRAIRAAISLRKSDGTLSGSVTHLTTMISSSDPRRAGAKGSGPGCMRMVRTSMPTLPIIGTRFQAMGEVQRAAL